jgi:4'-phosphopantetheinyl transferase EntD
MLQSVAPPGAFAAGMTDTGQPVPFYPEESVFVAGAVAKRQREFALGRACARRALAALGQGEMMIARKGDGAPLWPRDVVGSISHTDGYAVALAAPVGRFRGLGVDVERRGRVVPPLYGHLFEDAERQLLQRLPPAERDALAALLFSAKEACCKIWLSRHGGPLPFTGIRVVMTEANFIAHVPARGYGPLTGRAALADKLVLAAAWDAA